MSEICPTKEDVTRAELATLKAERDLWREQNEKDIAEKDAELARLRAEIVKMCEDCKLFKDDADLQFHKEVARLRAELAQAKETIVGMVSEIVRLAKEHDAVADKLAEKDALVASAKRVMRQLYGNMPDGVEVEIGEWLDKAGEVK